METLLNDREARVLGCLMEKAMATPEYYPLSLNALTNACNQRSNRDPIVDWDEDTVHEALADLDKKGLVNRSTVGRVPKFEETFSRRYNMVACEAAVMCVLLLRGPQTPGAIRAHTQRLCAFESLESLQETLDRLGEWEMIRRLERLPGHKESRYAQLLCGDPDDNTPDTGPRRSEIPEDEGRLVRLESTVEALKDELTELKIAFESFRREFE